MSSLSEKQVDLQLQDLPGWQRDGNSIVKSFKFNDFVEFVEDEDQSLIAENGNDSKHKEDIQDSEDDEFVDAVEVIVESQYAITED